MNSLKRLMAVLESNLYDDALCVPLVFGSAASLAGVKLKKYLQNGECLAQCQMYTQKRFGYDAVFVCGDNCIEAEAIGSKVHFPENAYPYIAKYVLDDFRQLGKLPPIDPQKDGRMPELLQAAKFLRANVGDNLPVVGVLLGPMSIASQLMGLEKLLYLLIDSPCDFEYLINYTSEISLKFGIALLKAGIHIPAVMEPSASQSVVPSEIFVRYILPQIREIFARFKSSGALASWLMITGDTQDILQYYPNCGADLATIDYEVSLKEALDLLPDLVIAGNIKPYSFVYKTPQQITFQGKELIDIADRRKFILSSGCEIPLDTKPENLAALVNITRSLDNDE